MGSALLTRVVGPGSLVTMLNYRPRISTRANGSVKIRLQSTLSPRSTRRFLANQTPTLRFSALLNEEVADAELALIGRHPSASPLVRRSLRPSAMLHRFLV